MPALECRYPRRCAYKIIKYIKEAFLSFTVGRCLLRDRLAERHMTLTELSDKIGISKQQLSDYANNRFVMSLRNAKIIAYALNCCIDDLYEWRPLCECNRKGK